MSLLQTLVATIIKLLRYIPVFIYNLMYSRFYTRWTYYLVADRLEQRKHKVDRILDVGIGTGHPMKQIINRISEHTKVVGIDIDQNYLMYARETFKNHSNVSIRYQNFYELEKLGEKYDVIIFSSSFMIMPDRIGALKVAKASLTPNGSIFFLLTLEQQKTNKTIIIEKIKPYLKYITTIEFGSITYETDFRMMMNENHLQIIYNQQVANKSLFLWLFRMFVIEVQLKN